MKNLNFYSLDVSGTQTLRMMVNEDGNVGIGTSIATKKLEVAGDISFNGNIYQNGNLFSGSGGGGSSTFTGLSDTPSSFTASKFLAVNSGGNSIEFVDAPSGGGGGGSTIDETTDVSLNNLKVHGDLSANDASFNVVEATSIRINGVDLINGAPAALDTLNELAAALDNSANFATNVLATLSTKQDSLTAGTNITISGNTISSDGGGLKDLSASSISDLSDVSLNGIQLNQTLKWDGEKLVPTTFANTVVKQGQVLETLIGVCDGRTVDVESGNYTFPDISSQQQSTTSYASLITFNYTAPSNTKQVIIDYKIYYDDDNSSMNTIGYRLSIGNQAYSNDIELDTLAGWSNSVHMKRFVIDVNGTDDISNGKLSNWTGSKEIDLEVRHMGSELTTFHKRQNLITNSSIDSDVMKPIITITAIGETAGQAVTITSNSANDLGDISFNSATTTNGQALVWNSADSIWEAGTVVGGGGGGGSSTFIGLSDTPASLTASKFLAVNSAGNSIEFVDAPSGSGGGGSGSTIDETTDVSLNSLKVHGDLSANDASFNAVEINDSLNVTGDYQQNGANINTIYATIASPTLTGTPAAPTASSGTNTTQLATTAFVSTAVSNLVNGAPGALDTLSELASALDNSGNFATNVTNTLGSLQTQIDTKQATLSFNAPSSNNTNPSTSAQIKTALDAKQDTLTAGTNITITGTTISASGGGGGLTDLSASSISDLSDVSFNPISTTNGQALVWNSTDSVWEAGTVASSGGVQRSSTEIKVSHSSDVKTTTEDGEIYQTYNLTNLFDTNVAVSGTAHSSDVFQGTNNTYSGSTSSTNSYAGIWIQQEYNSPVYFTKFVIYARANSLTMSPGELKVFVGNDGTNWTEYHSFTKTSYTASEMVTTNFASTTTPYTFIRFVFHKTVGNNYLSFNELEIYGNKDEEPSSINDLSDVSFNSITATDGQALVWNSTDGVWEAGAVASSGSTIDETTDVSLNNLKVHGDLSANDASFNVIDSSSINITGTSYMQSIIPSTNNTYSLGDPSSVWKDIYIGPGSLYIDGQKVLESDANTIVVGADENQNLKLNTTGTGVTQIESANGIQINSTGSGNIELGSTGSGIVRITNNLALNGNVEIFNDSTDMVKINDSLLVTGDISFNGNLSQNGANINTIYATIASPTLTGTPLAPTASSGTNTTQLATTAFVSTAVSNLVNAAPGALDTLSELAAALDNSANFATNVTTTLGDLQTQINTKVTASSTDTFTNKTIDADGTGNSITNIDNANIKASAGIVYSKLSIADNDLTIAKTSGLQTALDEELCKIGTQEYAITVASKTATNYYNGTGSSSAFFINGNEGPYLKFTPGKKYKFLQDDGTNSNHPFKFYLEVNKTTEYSTNVTLSGTAGQSGSYTEIEITDSTPTKLYYQCANHSYMGNVVYIDGYSNITDGDLTIAKTSGLQAALDAKQATLTAGTNITITGTTISASGGGGLTDLSATSISDLSDVSLNGIQTNQSLKWDGEKLVPYTLGTTATSVTKQGQVLETLVGVCDGRTVVVESGSYTLPNITSQQVTTTSYASLITFNYTAPSNTKQVIIDYKIYYDDDDDGTNTIGYRLSIANQAYSNDIELDQLASWSNGIHIKRFIIDVNGTNDIANGKLSNWTSSKEIDLEVRDMGGQTTTFHKRRNITTNSGLDSDIMTPSITITAIGESSGQAVTLTTNSVNDLSDISFNSASTTDGQALVWNSTDSVWEAGAVASSGGGGLTDLSATSISDLSDVSFNSLSTSQGSGLIWNNTDKLWEPGTLTASITNTTTTTTVTNSGGWVDKNPTNMPFYTLFSQSVSDGNDKLYFAGGKQNNSGNGTNHVWEYTLSTNSWAQLSTTGVTPAIFFQHTTVFYNNAIYTFAGWNLSSNNNTLHKLDLSPATPVWSVVTTSGSISARRDPRAALYGSKLVTFGGYSNSAQKDLYEIDLAAATPTWTLLDNGSTLSIPAQYSVSVGVYQDKFSLIAYTDYGNSSSLIHYCEYDLINGGWSEPTTTGAPTIRFVMSFTMVDDKFYLYGGVFNGTYYNNFYVLDVTTKVFTEISSSITMPNLWHCALSPMDNNTKLILYGGMSSPGYTLEYTIPITTTTTTYNPVEINKLSTYYALSVGPNYDTSSLDNSGSLIVEGNVGIGISDPSGYKLEVAGDISFNGNLYQNGALFTSGGGGLTDLSATSISDLSDVSFNSTTTTDGATLLWDTTEQLWKPSNVTNTIGVNMVTTYFSTYQTVTLPTALPGYHVSELDLIIKPTYTDSIIEIKFNIYGDFDENACFRIKRNNDFVVPTTDKSTNALVTGIYDNDETTTPITHHVRWYDTPNTTDSITYKLYINRAHSSSITAYINGTGGNSTDWQEQGISTSTVIEHPKPKTLVPATSVTKQGQVLETLAGRCDGRTVVVESGSYTLPNITSQQVTTTSYASLITFNYTPPSNTKQVIIDYKIFYDDFGSGMNNVGYRFSIANQVLSNAIELDQLATHSNGIHIKRFIIDVTGTDDIANGKLANWTTSKEIDLEVRAGDAGYLTTLHKRRNITTNSPSDSDVLKPSITITAIGESSGQAVTLTTNSVNDLSDISFNSASTTDGQALVWNSTDSVWEAGAVASSGSTIDETTDVSVNNLSVHHSLDVSNSLIVSDGSTKTITEIEYWYSNSSNFSWSLHNDGTSTAPVSRNNHTSVIDNSGNIIIFGGDDSVSERNDAWKYSISSNSWSELFSSTTPSTGSWDQISGSPASSSISDGVGYNKELYIGCDSGATFHKYNPSTDVWTTLASKSQSHYGSEMMVSYKGHIYSIDAVNGERSVWDYNISANSWSKLSNFSDSTHDRYGAHVSVYNGIIYVLAGRHIPYQQGYFSDIWTYNISTNTWSEITSVTTTLDGNSASFPTFAYGSYTSHGDNIYMVYGYASSGSDMNTVYIYNITNNTMTGYTTSMPASYTSSVSLHENCLYMFGGYVGSSNVNTLIKYDLETKTHTTISQSGTWPSARRDLRWTTLGNTFYALGGYTSSDSTDVWRYTLDDTPQKIKNTSSVLNGDEIITVFGGSNGNVCYSSIYNFNLTNNSWSYITPSKDTVAGDTTHGNQRGIPLERDDHTFVKYNNKAYLFGGKNGSTTYYDTWEYDLSTTTWTKKAVALSSYARYGHTSIIYNGNMYVFGGYNGTTYFNNVLKYDITNDSWSEYNDGTGDSTPSSRYGHVANLIQPEMIIFGGISANGAVKDSYAFDFTKNSWHLLDNDDANRPNNPQSTNAELYNTGTGYKWFVFGGSNAISIASQILYENFEAGYYTGNVTSATIVSGGYNSSNALQGGGKNSYDRWRLGDTTFQSVSFWYYRDKANSGNQVEALFDNNRATNGTNSLYFNTDNTGGHLDKVHFTSTSSAVSKLYIDGVDESSAIDTGWSNGWSSTTYADNTWHHFYIEFASSQTSPITFGQPENAAGLYAGSSEYPKWGGGGKFDNVRIFSSALTTTQIAILLENNNKMHVADISNANVNVNTTTYNGFTYNTNNDGRVSIGKLNPTKELDVVGDGIFTGSVTSSGSVLTSDDRVKHNEQSIVNALSTISKLRPKHYFKTGSHLYDASHNFVLNANGVPVNISNTPLILNKDYTVETGIIAQEIQSIPELKFAVQNTTPLGVDYNSIHCTHIAATKELHQIVQHQQIQIETIKELVQSQQTTIEEQQQEIEQLKLVNQDMNNQFNQQLQQDMNNQFNQQLQQDILVIKQHIGL